MYRKLLKIVSLKKPLKFEISHRLHSNQSYVIPSPLQRVHIPDAALPDIIFEKCGKFPEKIAMECAITGRKYTYEDVRNKAINFSQAITKKLKLRKGDVVTLILPNIPEFGICILGLLKASLIVTTINPLNTLDEMRRQLVDSGSKAIITTCSLHLVVKSSAPLPNMPILTIKTEKTDSTPENVINFQDFVDTPADRNMNMYLTSSEIAVMAYSSGTTGLPKGVLHSHRNLVTHMTQTNVEEIKILEPTTDKHQDVVPAIIPFTHLYGINAVLISSLLHMSKIVTVPKFNPDVFLNLFKEHKPTALHVVPASSKRYLSVLYVIIFIFYIPVLFMINNKMVDHNLLQSLRIVTVGSAPLSSLNEEKFVRKTGNKICLMQGYGTTESNFVTFTRKSDDPTGSVGVPVPNTEMKVVAVGSDTELDHMQEGELFVKGPQIMQGYHKRSDETAKTIIDGWLKTGDLVYYDKNKKFYIVDRLKDMIKVKGYQVAPAELEDVICSYADILDAVVIGVPHDTYGEVPRAYVTVKPGTKLDVHKLEQFMVNKVSNYKYLKGGVVVVKDLPRNALGKYVRHQLRLKYMDASVTKI
ncbi:hypothetical protein RI129_007507 [Pyrocoelia pectoralis]|uniref:4-coumarate--CoA ligase n=1 Tax=Pyrocoelia pectoralis TaxID=417401 RepID=A0AAN7V9T3_9COLE